MSLADIADIWDRIFWSAMLALLVGLVWLKFLDPIVPCVGPGLIVAVIAGGIYFYLWWRKARRAGQTDESAVEGE
jgi:hypothetical protein